MKNYKIERRPTIWQVVLSSGEYSDYSEQHLFFRANSPEEAWMMMCEYKNDNDYDCNLSGAYIWGKKKFVTDARKKNNYEINWDTCYGDAKDVEIKMLDLIVFSRLKINI